MENHTNASENPGPVPGEGNAINTRLQDIISRNGINSIHISLGPNATKDSVVTTLARVLEDYEAGLLKEYSDSEPPTEEELRKEYFDSSGFLEDAPPEVYQEIHDHLHGYLSACS